MKEIDYIVSIFDPAKEFPYRLEGFKNSQYVTRSCSRDFEGAVRMFARMSGLSLDQIRDKMVMVARHEHPI